MAKILSQAGVSLADAYAVQGSIAGVDELLSRDVNLVHEMGQTMFMERIRARIFRMTTGSIAQNISYAVAMNPVTASAARLMSVIVITSNAARIANCNVSIRDPINATEMPVFVWDETNSTVIRFDDGNGLDNLTTLHPIPEFEKAPISLYGIDVPEHVNAFRLRGLTTGFGAGTVTITALLYLAFTDAAGALSSKGVPIPSW